MRLVVDSNIFIAALLKDGTVRRIIVNFPSELFLPEVVFDEIGNRRRELLEKSKLSEKEFEVVINKILKYVRIVPNKRLIKFRQEAEEIIKKIDEDDVPFVAASLALGSCSIWSDDKHFRMQKVIEIYTTEEIIQKLDL